VDFKKPHFACTRILYQVLPAILADSAHIGSCTVANSAILACHDCGLLAEPEAEKEKAPSQVALSERRGYSSLGRSLRSTSNRTERFCPGIRSLLSSNERII
jgi:hypothetical protein